MSYIPSHVNSLKFSQIAMIVLYTLVTTQGCKSAPKTKSTPNYPQSSTESRTAPALTAPLSCDGAILGIKPLSCIPVPQPSATVIVDKQAAIALGKALFWDIQVGSDSVTACATCHFAAGADRRIINILNPGPDNVFRSGGVTAAEQKYHPELNGIPGLNCSSCHPQMHNAKTGLGSVVGQILHPISDDDRVGSQGIAAAKFTRNPALGTGAVEFCAPVPGGPFKRFRQVTSRNAPTNIGAVFYQELFWDGRASQNFNGVDPFGDTANASTQRVLAKNAALASQAMGPVTGNAFEMNCLGRSLSGNSGLAAKLLPRQPLRLQGVATTDSALGSYARLKRSGLYCDKAKPCTYQNLVDKAFGPVIGGANAKFNFGRIFGEALQAYQSTLIPDQTPFDSYLAGNAESLTAPQKNGLNLFTGKGHCLLCHNGSTLSDASESVLAASGPQNQDGGDPGFHNIGIRPASEDPGRGGAGPNKSTFSVSKASADNGAFKTASLRNVKLTAPYFHHGGMWSLEDVVRFYNTVTESPDPERSILISPIDLTDPEIADLVDFLRNALTDPRVEFGRAPFDHPSIQIPNGPTVPAVGKEGGLSVLTFNK